MSIRILLADDHALFRNGVRLLLERENDLEVVAEAGDGFATLDAARSQQIDLLLLDLGMPGLLGAKVAESVLREKPNLPIVVLTMHEDEYHLRELFRIGVRGFLLKKSTGPDLLQAVRAVLRGERYVDQHLAGRLLDTFIDGPSPKQGDRVDLISQREKEICGLLAQGYTNREIADLLCISERTVECHRASLMAKLELRTRADLVRFAVENGLFQLT